MIGLLLLVILLGCFVYILRRAPEGYEDEGGFHVIDPVRTRPQHDKGLRLPDY